jgi:hypothetical protein
MRPTAWVSFVGVFLLAAAVCSGRQAPVRPAAAAEHLSPSWVVAGEWMTTDEEAVQDALEKARGKVNEYLRAQNPPMEWPIDPTYLRQKLWADLPANDVNFLALKWNDPREKKLAHVAQVQADEFKGLGRMYQAAVQVTISQFARDDFQRQERVYQVKKRQDRAAARQGVLIRVLAGLVAVLTAVACYLRLEDATKGYYTTLLRLAAVGFVTLVGAGIWLLT